MLIIIYLVFGAANASQLPGVLMLDRLSFGKVVDKFNFTLVKFDEFYPVGNHHTQFGQLAKEVIDIDDIMIAQVQVKDYGEKTNSDLAKSLGVIPEKSSLPTTILYKRGKETGRFTGEYTVDDLQLWISMTSEVYIQRWGCYRHFDVMASRFMAEGTEPAREKVLGELVRTENLRRSRGMEIRGYNGEMDDMRRSSEVYLKLMRRVLEQGDTSLTTELNRINNLLNQKLSPDNENLMKMKRNIVNSFIHRIGPKYLRT